MYHFWWCWYIIITTTIIMTIPTALTSTTSLKQRCGHFDEFFTTPALEVVILTTSGAASDVLKFHQNDNISISVNGINNDASSWWNFADSRAADRQVAGVIQGMACARWHAFLGLDKQYGMEGLTQAPAIPQSASSIPNATATTNTQIPWVTNFSMFCCETRQIVDN